MSQVRKLVSTLMIAVIGILLIFTQVSPLEAANLYEYYTTGDDINRLVYGATWRTQTFSVAANHSVTSIKLKLSRQGSPGLVTVSIQPVEEDDYPTGVDLTSGSTTGNDLTTTPPGEWRTIVFTTPYTLIGGAKYAIVLRALSGDSSNTVRWRIQTVGGYAGGMMRQSTDSGGSWNNSTADCMFEVWGESVVETATEVWVDDDWASYNPGDVVGGHTFGTDAFATIQDGINAITGSTVHVAEGVYSPLTTIRINKDNLVLLGTQADADPRPSSESTRIPGSAGEAVIDGYTSNLGRVIEIQADNVVVNGLEVKTGSNDIICQDSVHTGTIVKYCIVHDGTRDDGIQLKYCTDGILEYNYVFDIAPPGDALSMADSNIRGKIQHNEVRDISTANAAIHIYGSDDMEIVDNLIDNVTLGNNKGGNAIRIGNKSGEDIDGSGIQIKSNIIRNIAGTAIEVFTSQVLIEGNDIYNCTSEYGAIHINFAVSDISIYENSIHDNTLSISSRANSTGIFVESTVDTSSVDIHFNNIYNNSPYGVANEASPSLDARNNWWGANNGPSHSPGSGDKVSINVDTEPWLISGISANPNRVAKGGYTSLITADMTHNSNGEDTLPEGHIPDGTEIIFSTDKGTIGSTQITKLTTNGQSTATLISSDNVETATVSAKAPGDEVQSKVSTSVEFFLPRSVGGELYPVNKVAVLIPWIGVMAIIAGAVLLALRRKSDRH